MAIKRAVALALHLEKPFLLEPSVVKQVDAQWKHLAVHATSLKSPHLLTCRDPVGARVAPLEHHRAQTG